MAEKITIPDCRSTDPEDYETLVRRGRMKQSWELGVRQSKKGEMITIDEGLTWGSIGQILGYLFGKEDEGFQEELFEKMRDYYSNTVRGQGLRKKK